MTGLVPVSHQLLFLSNCLSVPCSAVGEWYEKEAVQCVVPALSVAVKLTGFDGLFCLFDVTRRFSLTQLNLTSGGICATPVVVVGICCGSRRREREVSASEGDALCRRHSSAVYLELDLETGEDSQAAFMLLVKLMRDYCEKHEPLYVRNGGIAYFNAARRSPVSAAGLFRRQVGLSRNRPSLSISDFQIVHLTMIHETSALFQPGSLGHEVWIGNLSGIEKILRAGASVDDVCNSFGDTSLHFAAFLDNLALVEFLLAKGASAYLTNVAGQSPLHLASAFSSVAVCQAMVDAGSDKVAERDSMGMSPLAYAIYAAKPAIFRYLYGTLTAAGIQELQEEQRQSTEEEAGSENEFHLAHFLAASINCEESFTRALLDGSTFAIEPNAGQHLKPLHVAATFGNLDAFSRLLETSDMADARTAFVAAAKEGSFSIMKHIWDHAGRRSRYFSLTTPLEEGVAKAMADALMAAVCSSRLEIISWLLRRESQYFCKVASDSVLLIKAAALGMPTSVIAGLIRLGVDVNAADEEEGITPIIAAAAHGHLRLLHNLIENGASLFARDKRGYGALHHACGNDNVEVIESLLDLGLNANEHNLFGESPVMVAVGQGSESALRLALAHMERQPPHDPLGTLKIWPKGPFLQVVMELREEDFIESDKAIGLERSLVNARMVLSTGWYMGIQINARRLLAPVDTQEIAHLLSLKCLLRHRNLQQFLGICSDGVSYSLLSEVPGNSPPCWLSSAIRLNWTAGAITLLLKNLLKGLAEMHRESAGKPVVLHRNLQSSSIMLNVKYGPIVCELQESALGSSLHPMPVSGCVGPMGWRPPECHTGMNFDQRSDVFGFACILYELLHGKFPFSEYHFFDIPRKIMAGDRPKVMVATSPLEEFLVEMLESCWAQNPDDRPSFSQLSARLDAVECSVSAQEELERLFARAMKDSESPTELVSAPHIRYVGLCTHVSRAALGLDDNLNPNENERLTLIRVLVESSEYYARQVPLMLVKIRRLQLCQMRVLDIGTLPSASTSKHPGVNNVLRVLYLNQTMQRIHLFTHRFDYVLFDQLKHMAHERRQHWSPAEVQDMALQIARGMSFLCTADPPVHHCFSDRDIFISEEDGKSRVMVGGFGLVQLLTANHNWRMLGDPGFIDASLLSTDTHLYNTVADRNHRLASEESDVFSFGMVLRTILALKRPWDGVSDVYPNDCVLQGIVLEPIALSSSYKALEDLSKDCINPLRRRRPKLKKIIARLEAMKNLSTTRDKYRPKLARGLNSFQQPVVSVLDDYSENAVVSFSHISLPVSKLGPAGLLLIKSEKFKSECGAFLVSGGSSNAHVELQLDQDMALDDYTTSFLSLPHSFFYGVGPGGPVVICISKAKGMYMDEPVYRVLIRMQSGDERCYIPASTKLLLPKKGQEGTPPSAAQLLSALRIINSKFDRCNFSVIRDLTTNEEATVLIEFENATVNKNYSFGVIYAKAGQMTLSEMLANEPSPAFETFVTSIGDICKLSGFSRYAGGLDTKYDSTGVHSVYSRFRDCEVMFHVATMLPDDASAARMRARFLSQHVCVIVFQDEGSTPLSPALFADWPLVHVVVVVRPVTARAKKSVIPTGIPVLESFALKQSKVSKAYYQVAVSIHRAVQPFAPHLENPVFEKSQYFRYWLLSKLINGHRSGFRSDTKLRAKEEVTRATRLAEVERKMLVLAEERTQREK